MKRAIATVAQREAATTVDIQVREAERIRSARNIQSGDADLIGQRLIDIERVDRNVVL